MVCGQRGLVAVCDRWSPLDDMWNYKFSRRSHEPDDLFVRPECLVWGTETPPELVRWGRSEISANSQISKPPILSTTPTHYIVYHNLLKGPIIMANSLKDALT
jgi:hypothetical protein